MVGLVDQDDESTIIWVNQDYDLLDKPLGHSSLTEQQINVRADRHLFPVACGLWLQHHETTKMETPPDDEYLEPAPPGSPRPSSWRWTRTSSDESIGAACALSLRVHA